MSGKPRYVSDLPLLKVHRRVLMQQANPYVSTIWPNLDTPITRQEVQKALINKEFVQPHERFSGSIPRNYELFNELGAVRYRDFHVRRIAYLIANPPNDALEINVGDFEAGIHPQWIVEDGNHRLAGLLFEETYTPENEFILCNVMGSYDTAKKMGFMREAHIRDTASFLTAFPENVHVCALTHGDTLMEIMPMAKDKVLVPFGYSFDVFDVGTYIAEKKHFLGNVKSEVFTFDDAKKKFDLPPVDYELLERKEDLLGAMLQKHAEIQRIVAPKPTAPNPNLSTLSLEL